LKKGLVIFMVALLATLLVGCDMISDSYETSGEAAFQERILESRDVLRQSNVGVEMNVTPAEPTNGGFTTVSQGSGVIVDERDGMYYVLTNFHVVDSGDADGRSFSVLPLANEGERIIAEKMATCEARDLALLRFETEETFLPIDMETRKDDDLRVGEFLLAAGNPSAVDGIVTFGEYKGETEISHVEFPVLAHNALIYSGSSGGALSDLDGNLVGINTWSSSSGAEPLNMAVPLDEIHAFLDAFWSENE